jgi:hypothetical protein
MMATVVMPVVIAVMVMMTVMVMMVAACQRNDTHGN